MGLGLPAAGAAPVQAAPVVAPDPQVWVSLESRGVISQGAVMFSEGQGLTPGAVQLGDRAIVTAADGHPLCLKRVPRSSVGPRLAGT